MPRGFTGHVRAPNKDHLIALSARRHGKRLSGLLKATPPAQWDSRALGWIPPIEDQQQCGSCWCFSGTGVVDVAYWKAGQTNAVLSEEYTLDCGKNGGCDGDDNTNVLEWAKATGLPLSSAYGKYTAGGGRTGTCAFKQAMALYKLDDWGFADGSGGNGVTPTAAIKAAIMQYGCVGCAVAAGGDSFWDSGTGIGTGRSSQIDHDVIIVGWDDTKGSGGCWIMRNSWNTSWGDKCANAANPNPVEAGYAWVQYGAYDLGTEAVWGVVNSTAAVDYFV